MPHFHKPGGKSFSQFQFDNPVPPLPPQPLPLGTANSNAGVAQAPQATWINVLPYFAPPNGVGAPTSALSAPGGNNNMALAWVGAVSIASAEGDPPGRAETKVSVADAGLTWDNVWGICFYLYASASNPPNGLQYPCNLIGGGYWGAFPTGGYNVVINSAVCSYNSLASPQVEISLWDDNGQNIPCTVGFANDGIPQ